MLRRGATTLVSSALAFSLALVPVLSPVQAYAVESGAATSADKIVGEYGDLSTDVVNAGEALNDATYALSQTNDEITNVSQQIETTKTELASAQSMLADRIAARYRAGNVSLIDMLMSSASVEDAVSALYYFDKLTEEDTNCVNNAKELKTSLEQRLTELNLLQKQQEDQVKQEQERRAELGDFTAARDVFVANLGETLQQAISSSEGEEREQLVQLADKIATQVSSAETPEQLNMAVASVMSEAGATNATAAVATSSANTATNAGASSSDAGSASSDSSSSAASSAASTAASAVSSALDTSSLSDVRQQILDAAYSQIGVQYVFGAEQEGVAFDCSGFTSWVYDQVGVDLPHSAAAQAGYVENKDVDELEPGDLLVWEGTGDPTLTGNHVAIYAGDGQIIHATWSGVTVADLYDGYTTTGSVL